VIAAPMATPPSPPAPDSRSDSARIGGGRFPPGRPERPPQADLRPPARAPHDHHVSHSYPASDELHGPQPEQQPGNRCAAGCWSPSLGRAADPHLLGCLGLVCGPAPPRTASTWAGRSAGIHVPGAPSAPRSDSATGESSRAERSISGARGPSDDPDHCDQWSPSQTRPRPGLRRPVGRHRPINHGRVRGPLPRRGPPADSGGRAGRGPPGGRAARDAAVSAS